MQVVSALSLFRVYNVTDVCLTQAQIHTCRLLINVIYLNSAVSENKIICVLEECIKLYVMCIRKLTGSEVNDLASPNHGQGLSHFFNTVTRWKWWAFFFQELWVSLHNKTTEKP